MMRLSNWCFSTSIIIVTMPIQYQVINVERFIKNFIFRFSMLIDASLFFCFSQHFFVYSNTFDICVFYSCEYMRICWSSFFWRLVSFFFFSSSLSLSHTYKSNITFSLLLHIFILFRSIRIYINWRNIRCCDSVQVWIPLQTDALIYIFMNIIQKQMRHKNPIQNHSIFQQIIWPNSNVII